MPVELSIVESVTELETTVVEVILESASEPGPAGPQGAQGAQGIQGVQGDPGPQGDPGEGVPTGGTTGQVLAKASDTDFDTEWSSVAGGGAPTDADYLVGTANGSLSNEIVVGTSPGGELGGTWASPTVDATHSGSSHAAVQAAAEATAAGELATHAADTTSVHGIADTSVLATDSEVATAVSDHNADTTSVHGIADTSALALTANAVMDGDTAGGVLSGTYPNPGFAADMATQAELDAHVTDSSAAHAASAISADSTTLVGTGTDVQAVLEELDNGIADHLADTSDAHDASAVSVLDSGGFYTATDVEAVLAEIATWADYTPALTASITNPTLGSGSAQIGRYLKIGKLIIGIGRILFGSSGAAAGSGSYRFSLPVAMASGWNSTSRSIGSGLLLDSGTTRVTAVLRTDPSLGDTEALISATGTNGTVANNVPWTWTNNDFLEFIFFYEAA